MSQESPEQKAARLVQDVGSPIWRISFGAQEELVALGEPAARALAARLWADAIHPGRELLSVLARIGPPAVLAILPLLEHEIPIRRLQALELLAELDPALARARLGRHLFAADVGFRAYALGILLSSGAVPPPEWFDDQIATSGIKEASEHLLESLRHNISAPGAGDLVIALAPNEQAIDLFVTCLQESDPAIADAGQQGLLRLGESSLRRVTSLLGHPDPPVRSRAAAMLRVAGEAAIEPLLEVLSRAEDTAPICPECRTEVDPDHPCCEVCGCRLPQAEWSEEVSLACRTLPSLGAGVIVPLCKLAERSRGRPQLAALRTLVHMRTSEAIPCLIHALPGANGEEAALGLLAIAQVGPNPRFRLAIPALQFHTTRKGYRTQRHMAACWAALSTIYAVLGEPGNLPLPASPEPLGVESLPTPAVPRDPLGELPRPSSMD